MAELTEEDRAVLEFEGAWFKDIGPKDVAVRERFGRSLAEHQRLVAWLIRQPEALEHAPTTVRRLRRLRDQRLARRRTQREASWPTASPAGAARVDFGSGPSMR